MSPCNDFESLQSDSRGPSKDISLAIHLNVRRAYIYRKLNLRPPALSEGVSSRISSAMSLSDLTPPTLFLAKI